MLKKRFISEPVRPDHRFTVKDNINIRGVAVRTRHADDEAVTSMKGRASWTMPFVFDGIGTG
jgi:hypothetical protein